MNSFAYLFYYGRLGDTSTLKIRKNLKTLQITFKKARFFQACLWKKSFQAIATSFDLSLIPLFYTVNFIGSGCCDHSLCVCHQFRPTVSWCQFSMKCIFLPFEPQLFLVTIFRVKWCVHDTWYHLYTTTTWSSIVHYKFILCFILDSYLLEFDDDEEDGSSTLPQRTVPFHKVVALPEGLRQ